MHIFRHLAQKFLAGRLFAIGKLRCFACETDVSPAASFLYNLTKNLPTQTLFVCVSSAPALCGIAQSYVALAYMTGILPIKKYGEHSALNMFTEVSMTNPREYAELTGFTEQEVQALCVQYGMPFAETKRWYDGYTLKGVSIYTPRSVVMSMTGHDYDNYWTETETFEALRCYIEMNYDGLQDTIVNLMGGGRKKIDTTTFTNDMVTFHTQDDVLTLLVHLGYLTYDFDTQTVAIPNLEIAQHFAGTVKIMGWENVSNALVQSDDLLDATLTGNAKKVAAMIQASHQENTSILQYHDENSLACVLTIAYYAAKAYYTIHRESPAGKGYADLIFAPRKNFANPAFIVELKFGKTADEAIAQIKARDSVQGLGDYAGKVLLVGISYDTKTKMHDCKIEEIMR